MSEFTEIAACSLVFCLEYWAAKTFVDLSYCRSEGIAVSETAQPGIGAAGRFDPIRAVIGQDVLRYHQAVIDYGALALFPGQ